MTSKNVLQDGRRLAVHDDKRDKQVVQPWSWERLARAVCLERLRDDLDHLADDEDHWEEVTLDAKDAVTTEEEPPDAEHESRWQR